MEEDEAGLKPLAPPPIPVPPPAVPEPPPDTGGAGDGTDPSGGGGQGEKDGDGFTRDDDDDGKGEKNHLEEPTPGSQGEQRQNEEGGEGSEESSGPGGSNEEADGDLAPLPPPPMTMTPADQGNETITNDDSNENRNGGDDDDPPPALSEPPSTGSDGKVETAETTAGDTEASSPPPPSRDGAPNGTSADQTPPPPPPSEPIITQAKLPVPPPPAASDATGAGGNENPQRAECKIPRRALPPIPELRERQRTGADDRRRRRRSTIDLDSLAPLELPRLNLSPPRARQRLTSPPRILSKSMSMNLSNLLEFGRKLPAPPITVRPRPHSSSSAMRPSSAVPLPHAHDSLRRRRLSSILSDSDGDHEVPHSLKPLPSVLIPGSIPEEGEEEDGGGGKAVSISPPPTPTSPPTMSSPRGSLEASRLARSKWLRVKLRMNVLKVVRIVRVARALEQLTPQQTEATKDPELHEEIKIQREMSEHFGVPPTVEDVKRLSAAERAARDMENMKAMMAAGNKGGAAATSRRTGGGGGGGRVIGVGVPSGFDIHASINSSTTSSTSSSSSSSRGGGRRRSSAASSDGGGRRGRRRSSVAPKTEAELKEMAAKAYAIKAQQEAAAVDKDTPEPHAYFLVQAFMDYHGEGKGELPLAIDNQLCQLKESPNHWCFGFRLSTPIGNFPSNYVERIETSNPLLPVYARVLFDFGDPDDKATLKISAGDILAVFDDNHGEPGWWIGAGVGPTGLWPKNFVQKMQLDFGSAEP